MSKKLLAHFLFTEKILLLVIVVSVLSALTGELVTPTNSGIKDSSIRAAKLTSAGLLLLLCLPLSAGELIATQLTSETIHLLPPGGLDAVGGIDDWLLSDGDTCAIISAAHHQAYLSLEGGTLVDLWHCDGENDQWVTRHDQINLAKEKIASVKHIRASSDKQSASITVRGHIDGLEVKTQYRLKTNSPGTLFVDLSVTRLEQGEPLHMMGTTILHPRGALIPFTLDMAEPEYSLGFAQPYVDTAKKSAILAAVSPANLQVLLGSSHIVPGISYGLRTLRAERVDAERDRTALKTFLIGSETFTMWGLFAEAMYSFTRKPSALTFLRGQLMDLEIGERLEVQREIMLGNRADVASITDRIYQGEWLRGTIDYPGAGIVLQDSEGVPYSYLRADEQGRFELRLPDLARSWQLQVKTPWSNSVFEVAGQERELTISVDDFATVMLPQGKVMSLIVVSLDNESDPVFRSELTGISVGGEPLLVGAENNRISLTGLDSDMKSIRLKPGRYRIIATRGIEYELQEQVLDLVAASSVKLEFAPLSIGVETKDLIAADLHVHSGISMDSSLNAQQRIKDFIAQGGELLVTSEHNISYDIAPVVRQMGAQQHIATISGVELTGMARSEVAPTSIGHANVFPVDVDTQQFMGGTLAFEGKRLGDVIALYKQQRRDNFFQLNHPRAQVYDDDVAFFNHLSVGRAFDATLDLDKEPNTSLLQRHASGYRDIDFDGIELLNGEALDEYAVIREDWFSLLRQGYYKVATANSDSHLSAQLVALPRTYIQVADDNPAALDSREVMASLSAGKAFGTNGPIIHVSLAGYLPGETLHASRAELTVTAAAVSWIDIDELRIYINGEITRRLPMSNGETHTVPLSFSDNSFVTVEVSGRAGELYRIVAPGHEPLAFSNPVFVNVNSKPP